jgi:UMP-CMP kinase
MGITCSKNKKFQVVFILGGPGAGKGTQCEMLSEKLGWAHLSAGDLLRAERKSESDLAEIINAKISAGQIVPSSITVTLLKNAMENIYSESGSNQTKFLIDGFPRSAENCSVWEEKMATSSNLEFVLFLDLSEDIMTGRLLERAKTSGRNDDNLEIIRKRFKTFRDESMPIVDMYEKKGLVKTIVADRSVEDVYEEVQALFEGI